jgi:hypothetical protein
VALGALQESGGINPPLGSLKWNNVLGIQLGEFHAKETKVVVIHTIGGGGPSEQVGARF